MKIVISNLDSRTTLEDVQQILKGFSDVSVRQLKSVVQSHTGKLLTYAYLYTDDRMVGESLLAELNNTEVNGNVIGIKETK